VESTAPSLYIIIFLKWQNIIKAHSLTRSKGEAKQGTNTTSSKQIEQIQAQLHTKQKPKPKHLNH
jgi:hypothetical protein